MDMSAMSALWPFATTKPIEKKERMPWRLCGLDLPTERKVNNQKDYVRTAEQLAVFPQQFP